MSSNLALSNSIPKRYALALYELVKENSELSQVELEIRNLKNLLVSSNDFNNLILNPTIGKYEQGKAVEKICEHLNFSLTLKKFLGLLANNRRLFFLKKVVDNFLKLISADKGELSVQLTSSKKLTTEELSLIKKDLSEYLKRKIEIKYTYEEGLIGGFKIQAGSIMIDTSIKSKLKRLEQLMIQT